MRKAVAAAIIAASFTTSACARHRDEDPGPMISRNFQVGNFTQVEVAGPFDVNIHTGANPGVSAQGNQKLIDRLEVEVKGDKLLIHTKNEHHWFGGWHWSHGKGTISVTVPMIEAATLAGSGGLNIDNVKGERFDGQIAGSGDLKIGAVQVGALKLGIAGSGGATANSGTAKQAEYEIAGSGDVDAQAIQAEEIKASIAGSGGIKAHASRAADVSIMGSGDVSVTGGAKCSISKAGSGSVNCS
jgi:putative autotransporter adhesin-like protein